VEHIQARTLAGLDKNNEKFEKYTAMYAKEKGVGRGDVDLILDGEMLDSLELVSHKNGELVIGYKDPSDELAGKVEGNRRGTYGQPKPVTKPRDFLGIDEAELEILVESYQDFEEQNGSLTQEEIEKLAEDLLEDV
jgi:hypothetical protein